MKNNDHNDESYIRISISDPLKNEDGSIEGHIRFEKTD